MMTKSGPAERAHPEHPGFKDRWLGLKKSECKQNLEERYYFCSEYVSGKRVLDIPCGVGWGTSLLQATKKRCGVDISDEAIDYATSHYEGIEFKAGNMSSIPYPDNTFDVVLCLEGFEHVDRETGRAFLSEAKRVLVDSGLIIMTCPVLNEKGEPSGNPFHICEYPEDELVALLTDNFKEIKMTKFEGPGGFEEVRFLGENT